MDHVPGNEAILTDYAKNLIRFKSRQLCRRRDFRSEEPEDVQQYLWLSILKAIHHFDPTKASLNTFIDRVVNTAVAMMVRSRERRDELWDGVGTDSLNGPPSQDGATAQRKSQTVTSEDLHRRIGTEPCDEVECREACEAIDHALSAMPNSQRRFCRKLMAGSVKALATELGVSRRQVRKQIADTRPYFERFGLGSE
ncbi:hypothetical protein BH11PLA2_BH11PLA2_37020 [soil metagenome]